MSRAGVDPTAAGVRTGLGDVRPGPESTVGLSSSGPFQPGSGRWLQEFMTRLESSHQLADRSAAIEAWRTGQAFVATVYREALLGLRWRGSPAVERVDVEPWRELSWDAPELPELVVCVRLSADLVRAAVLDDVLDHHLPAAYLPRKGVIRLRLATTPAQIGRLLADLIAQAQAQSYAVSTVSAITVQGMSPSM